MLSSLRFSFPLEVAIVENYVITDWQVLGGIANRITQNILISLLNIETIIWHSDFITAIKFFAVLKFAFLLCFALLCTYSTYQYIIVAERRFNCLK